MPTQQETEFANEMHAAGLLSAEDHAIALGNDIIPGERVLSDETIGEIVGEIVNQETREAIYAEQDGGVKLLSEEELAAADAVIGDGSPAIIPEATPAKKVRAAAKPKVAGPGKRVSRVASAGSLAAYAVQITGDATVQATVDGMAKKIQEKAIGIYAAAFNGGKMSVYTEQGLKLLRSFGTLKSSELVTALNTGSSGKAYTLGTSRSQAQQVVSVFKTLGITNADGTMNTSSSLLAKLPV